jgi:hypothetical protein
MTVFRVPSVWIRNKKSGDLRKINAVDYASDLGTAKYVNWELVKERRGDKPEETVSGKSLGIDAQISPEEGLHSEQVSRVESPKVRESNRRRAQRKAKDEEYRVDKGEE